MNSAKIKISNNQQNCRNYPKTCSVGLPYKPPHDKTNEMAGAPSKDSDQTGRRASAQSDSSLHSALNG